MQIKSVAEFIENYWHFGCHSDDLRNEGDYLLLKIGSQDVVLYHDGIEVIAFDNRCPHRGTRFFDSPGGNTKAVCKYHGWHFSKGKLVIPLQNELMPNSCTQPELNRFKTEWCGTFLFFSISPINSLINQLGDELFSILESISFDCQQRRDINQYIYECPWQVSIENALEPQHLPYIHPKTLNRLNLINCKNRFWGANSGVYFDIGDSVTQRGLERMGRFYDRGKYMHPGYMSLYLFPFSFISSTAGTSYSIQSFFPRSENETWFISRLYSVILRDTRYVEPDIALINAAIEMNRLVFQEDQEICKRITYDAWIGALNSPLYISEEKILAFRRQLLST